MKTSVISEEFRKRYLSDPKDKNAFEGRAVVFEGPEDYHRRIDDPSLKHRRAHHCCSCAASGPIGYPGSAEVVNMQAADGADKERHNLPALYRRWTAIRHIRLAIDFRCHLRKRQQTAVSHCSKPGTACVSISARGPLTS